jgi:hypothetical protein
MKKITLLIGVLLLVGVSLIGALPVFAGTSEFSGPITSSDPTFTRFSVGCGGLSGSSGFHFVTFTVDVSQGGNYVLNDIGFFDGNPSTVDSYHAFYSLGSFSPASPLNGCIDAGDDSSTITLSPGRYTMVVTTFSSGVTGNFIFTLTGPGDIRIVRDDCPNPLPANAVVRSIPAGAPTFYQPDLATQNSFNLPAGTWWVADTSGDFSRVWIACQADLVWVPTNAIAP